MSGAARTGHESGQMVEARFGQAQDPPAQPERMAAFNITYFGAERPQWGRKADFRTFEGMVASVEWQTFKTEGFDRHSEIAGPGSGHCLSPALNVTRRY